MLWFWRFMAYSFAGFLLEVAFARLTRDPKQDRKCFILLPLCPVYGLGALAIIWLAGRMQAGPLGVLFIGFAAATAAEYLMALLYETVLRVRFWDYSALPLNVGGRVCLPFSLCWTALALGLIYWLSPLADPLLLRIPEPLTAPAAILLLCDALVTAAALRRTGSTEVLRWYR